MLSAQLPSTAQGLARFGQVCRSRRLRCVVALAPPAWAVHGERASATFASLGLDADQADVAGVAQAVRAAVPVGIEVVDLTEPLVAVASDGPLYFTFDPHWTRAGHARVAETLEPKLP